MIYQLLRTSPKLSGQICINLPITPKSNQNATATIETLDVSTLSGMHITDRNMLKYNHIDNIKYVYSQTKDLFYDATGEYTGNNWLYNNGLTLDSYSHRFSSGTRRILYNKYNKQFSYLCPLWISESIDFSKLKFKISLYDESGVNLQSYIIAGLSDRVQNYLDKYFNHSVRSENSKEVPVNDDLINIKFKNRQIFISGVDVRYGMYATKDISYLMDDLIYRERPVMEIDDMLLEQFRQNNLIAQQLININILFDISDISKYIAGQTQGSTYNIQIETEYDGNIIPIKDFYTNYEKIKVWNAHDNDYSESGNVYDYLDDHHNIELITKNKFVQSIFHWSLIDDPEYIFNLYDGFAPVYGDGHSKLSGRFYNVPDLSSIEYSEYDQNIHWCKHYSFTYIVNTLFLHTMATSNEYKFTKINLRNNVFYINHNQFNVLNTADFRYESINGLEIANILVNANNYNLLNIDNIIEIGPYKLLYITSNDIKKLLIISYDKNQLTMGAINNYVVNNILDIPSNVAGNYFKYIGLLYDNWIKPSCIKIYNSIAISPLPLIGEYSPRETRYYKANNSINNTLYRYSGRICPTFINYNENQFNYRYNYIQWSDILTDQVKWYNTLLSTGNNPQYKSISYNKDISFYPYSGEIDDDNLPDFYTSNWYGEVCWYNKSKCWNLPSSIKIEVERDHNEDIEDIIWNALYDYLFNLMDIDTTNVINQEKINWLKNKFKSLYEASFDFEYASLTDIVNYKYTIQFNMI